MIPIRDENPTQILPLVSYTVLGACMLVFLWQLSLDDRGLRAAIYGFGVIPASLLQGVPLSPELYRVPAPLTIITSMFLHGGLMHLGGNMLYLWIFANNVEEAMGHARFVLFYLLCGVAAALAQALPQPASQTPMIGASGAISGVLGAYLLLYPRARVLVFIPFGAFSRLISLPAVTVLGFWFLVQLLSVLLVEQQGGGVAFGAHLGGFVSGVLLVPLLKRRDVRLFQRR